MRSVKEIGLTLVLFVATFAGGTQPPPPPPEPALGHCNDYNPLKNPYFGDLHVHTSYSLDAVQIGTETDPDDAYNFAKGGEIGLAPYDANGNPTRTQQLSDSLDFAATTDHSEFLAEASICFEGGTTAYWSPWCIAVRNGSASENQWAKLLAFALSVGGMVPSEGLESSICRRRPSLCNSRIRDVWQRTQDAAEDHYDRSTNCNFTTFVGYEYTGTPKANNLHRNIIFKGRETVDQPISYIDAPETQVMWDLLDSSCNNNPNGCKVIGIPHNSNLGGGDMFNPYTESGSPYTWADATQRARVEPLVEMYQHKGNSECALGMGPLASEDELCDFEMMIPEICTGGPGDSPDCRPLCSDLTIQGGAMLGRCVEPSDFVRGALRNGLAERKRVGANPFKLGFIGSTDTHNSIPGATEEDNFKGHVATVDDTLEERLADVPLLDLSENPLIGGFADGLLGLQTKSFSPGGLAVVWAEQNTRKPLFEAMQRRETYATSGTRLIVRFFGGWSYPQNLCGSADLVGRGYSGGVPMGGDLPPRSASQSGGPRFVLAAMQASNPDAVPLQRIQIVKGWTETVGGQVTTRERVFEVGGDPNNGAGVDLNTCEPQGTGFASLCSVWEDPEFDPSEDAFYYARVVENPSCRWQRIQCNEAQVDCATVDPESPLANCCNGSLPDTVQERAWTSPIWYTPQ